jgi:hypothetical protein
MVDDQIDTILRRISAHNLERIRASCEADGDRELVDIISAKLANDGHTASAESDAARS